MNLANSHAVPATNPAVTAERSGTRALGSTL